MLAECPDSRKTLPCGFLLSAACLFCFGCVAPFALASESIQFFSSPSLVLNQTSDLRVSAIAPTDIQSFVRNWSQFEILVPKKNFPIEASNCKETIQIRFKGIEPSGTTITAKQMTRWELLQAIRQNEQNIAPVILEVDVSAYMTKHSDGRYSLSYCNVFVD